MINCRVHVYMYHYDFLSSISNCDETQNRKCMFHRNVAQLISLSLLVHAHGLTLKLTLSLVFVMIFFGCILDDILYFCYITSYYDCNWWKLYIFYMYLSINTAWSIRSWVVLFLVIFLIQLTNDLIIFYWWHRTCFYWLKSVGDLCINRIIWFLLQCSKCKIVLNWNSLKQKWMSFKFIQH